MSLILLNHTQRVKADEGTIVLEQHEYEGAFSFAHEVSQAMGNLDGDFQDYQHHYAVDSTNHEGAPTTEAGKQYNLEGTLPTKIGGMDIANKEITLTFVSTEGVSKQEMAQSLLDMGYRSSYIDNLDFDSLFSAYCEEVNKDNNFTMSLIIDKNGNGILKVPDDFDINSGLWRLDKMTIPWNDETYSLADILVSAVSSVWLDFRDPTVTRPEDIDPPKVTGKAGVSISKPITHYKDMDGDILAEISHPENYYNARIAIPTSENLKYYLEANKALYDIDVRQYNVYAWVQNPSVSWAASYKSYDEIKVHKKVKDKKTGKEELKWVGTGEYRWVTHYCPGSGIYQGTVTRNDIYYDVPKSNIYPAQYGEDTATRNASNVLSSGQMSLSGTETKGPQNISVTKNSVSTSFSCGGPSFGENGYAQAAAWASSQKPENFLSNIQSAMKSWHTQRGKCDYSYEGLTVTTTSSTGEPRVGRTSNSTIKVIPPERINGTYKGSAYVYYSGYGNKYGYCNDVVIHTPVVNNTKLTKDDFENQKINVNTSKTYLQLDGIFTISIPDAGTHNPYIGYGTRTYNSYQGVWNPKRVTTWGKMKDVKIPFDTYLVKSDGSKVFVAKNTWISSVIGEEVSNPEYTFIVPVWVEERDDYVIETRVVAENCPDISNSSYVETNTGKNGDITHYIARKTILVEVIGKIYDLRVSSSDDPGWLNKIVNPGYITAKNFPFGQANQNTVTGYKYAPKLGYSFVFDFKTKGRKSNTVDIGVYPEFYFVGKDGKDLKKVDLYFRKSASLTDYVKIENSLPNTLNVRYSNTYMKVPQKEMVDSRRIYAIELFGKTYNYTSIVNIGSFAKMSLPHDLRLCFDTLIERYGDYDGVINIYGKDKTTIGKQAQADANSRFSGLQGEDHVIGSVGHWFVGYKLPSSTVAVPVGANIKTATAQNQTLRNGYILIKMNIKTKDPNKIDYLQYRGPEVLNEIQKSNWNKEFTSADLTNNNLLKPITLPNGTPNVKVPIGTIAIYETDQRANNDFEVIGTH